MYFSNIELTQDNIQMKSLDHRGVSFALYGYFLNHVKSLISEKQKSRHAIYKVLVQRPYGPYL